MRGAYSLAIAALLAVHVTASPIEKRCSFKVRTRRRAAQGVGAGCAAMMQASRKYGIDVPGNDVRKRAVTSDNTGSVAARPDGSATVGFKSYLENVSIGGQTLSLDFDTGSSDLWVFSTGLPKQTAAGHSVFSYQNSSTFTPLKGASWLINYGDGSSAGGVVGTDVVNIGGAVVPNQAVELATRVSPEFAQDINNDGLVGLGFSTVNTVQPTAQLTFFDNIMPTLPLPVFSVDLRNDSTGSYTFGAIDQNKFVGDLTDVRVNSSKGLWQVSSKSYAIGGQVVSNPNASPAIADTGTSLLIVDDDIADAYYAQVDGAAFNPAAMGVTYPCSSQLPDFAVAMGDYMATVPGGQITYAVSTDESGGTTCFGGVQGNGGTKLQIFGDVLFRSQYVVFDGSVPKLRVAPKA